MRLLWQTCGLSFAIELLQVLRFVVALDPGNAMLLLDDPLCSDLDDDVRSASATCQRQCDEATACASRPLVSA
jgi:hypothetical protein